MDTITEALTRYATTVDPQRLSVTDRGAARARLVDGLACAIGGVDGAPVVALRDVIRRRPVAHGCGVWGSDLRTTPELAALVNATALRFLDFNDYTVGGHPSDVLPALLAACEEVDATVADLLTAATVAYEVFGELGQMMIRYRGWDQSTTASIAAACGVGRVLDLSVDQLASAVGMVATSSVMLGKARRGSLSMWKAVTGPLAAQNGLLAAHMAHAGVTAPHDAFAGEFGFLHQVSGEYEIQRLDPDRPPHYLHKAADKHWPVHFDLQPAVWLGSRISAALDPARIARVRVETSEWTHRGTASDPAAWTPTTRETADHSLPYILAAGLAPRGSRQSGIHHDDFLPDAVADPARHALMRRIEVVAADDITERAAEFCTMRAQVTTDDRVKSDFVVSYRRDATMSDAERLDKWTRLTRESRLAARAPAVLASLTDLREAQPVRDLLAPLTVPL